MADASKDMPVREEQPGSVTARPQAASSGAGILIREVVTVPGDAMAGALLASAWLDASLSVARIAMIGAAYLALHFAGRVVAPGQDAHRGRGGTVLLAAGLAIVGVGAAWALRPILLSVALLYLALMLFRAYAGGQGFAASLMAGTGRGIGLLFGAAAIGGVMCPTAWLFAAMLCVYVACVQRRRVPGATRDAPSSPSLPGRPIVPVIVLSAWLLDLQFLAVPGVMWQRAALAGLAVIVLASAWRAVDVRLLAWLLLPAQAAMLLACPAPGPAIGAAFVLVWLAGRLLQPLHRRGAE